MNSKSEEQLSIRSFSILIIFDKLYLVNSCPNLVSSLENLYDNWEKMVILIQSQLVIKIGLTVKCATS